MTAQPASVDRVLQAVNSVIVDRPRAVIVVFLLLTAAFAPGMAAIEMDEGMDGFTEGIDAQDAQDRVDEEFEPPFEEDATTTQIIQRGENVLSRDALIRMLEVQQYLEASDDHRVAETSGIAGAVASSIDPTAETREDQIRTLEGASDAQVREAVRDLGESPAFAASLSEDFNPEEPEASATITVVTHESDVDERAIQYRVRDTVDSMDGEFVTFGSGILDAEFEAVIGDSMALVVPVVIALILGFLVTAYRDPIDVVLGLVALLMAVVWTFGFTGHAGIPFSMVMIAVPPLLLAVGIDFGIHAVNRYREERVAGAGIEEGMNAAAAQLLVAFFIVTGTTVIGFGANVSSDLEPIREFGFVASVGIVFTFLVFGVFLPATKVYVDRLREAYGVPEFGSAPLGSDESLLGRVLPVGAHLGRKAPVAVLVAALLLTGGAGAYATTVDTTFEEEDFLPAEELPGYAEAVPDPFAPGEYTVTGTINYLEDTFESGEDDEVTIYVEGPIHADHALESVHRAGEDPPSAIVTEEGRADSEGVVDVMHDHAADDEEFARVLDANDLSGNGVPDTNVGYVLERLLESDAREDALRYVDEDLRSMRVIYTVEADATQGEVTADAQELAADVRLDTTATGEIVVYHETTEVILDSALVSLALALAFTLVFLTLVYHVLEGRASLGVVNMFPIVVTVAVLGGTMPLLGLPLNALTGTVLSITIGVGVAYSVHVTHRFIDEYNDGADAYPALLTTLRGTGGALTGSMLTTLGGSASLVLAITPLLGQFGLLMSISVVYSYLMAVVVLPPTLIVWDRLVA